MSKPARQPSTVGDFAHLREFYGLMFLFLFTIMAVYLSSNLGLLWIFVEATILASALLVGFYNTEGAVEAGSRMSPAAMNTDCAAVVDAVMSPG